MNRFLKWSSWFRAHSFDIAGVIGLSLSANIFSSFYSGKPQCGYVLAVVSTIIWGVFGLIMMLCAAGRRSVEEDYRRRLSDSRFVKKVHEHVFEMYVRNGELTPDGMLHGGLLRKAAFFFLGGLLTVLWPLRDAPVLCQMLVDAISGGAACFLIAVGMWLVSRSLRFLNITQGAFYLLGAYLTIKLGSLGWLPRPVGFSSVAMGVGIGAACHFLVFLPLLRWKASPLVLLLASLGAYVVAVNAISLLFGDAVITARDYTINEGFSILSARGTPVQAVLALFAAALATGMELWLRRTTWGLRFRAFADSPALYAETGGGSTILIMLIFCLGGTGAVVAGVLSAYDIGATPNMAMTPLLMGAVAATICGSRGPAWLLIISIFLATIQQLSSWFLGLQWRDPSTLAVLLVFLIVVQSKSLCVQQQTAG